MLLQGFTASMLPWTAEEDAVLRDVYERDGIYGACELLPGRTRASIFHRANRLGLQVRRRWTAKDDERLTHLWEDGIRLSAIAKQLNRSPITTYWRAQKLGLQLGCPPGFEYLSDAADRAGYTATQLRPILEWAGVKLHMALSRPTKRQRHCHYVCPVEVDDALAAWHATEPLDTAARRVGVCSQTLRRWLTFSGVKEAARGHRQHWRVRFTDVERAMSLRATHSSILDVARVLGVNKYTLAKELRAARVGVSCGHRLWVSVDDARAVCLKSEGLRAQMVAE